MKCFVSLLVLLVLCGVTFGDPSPAWPPSSYVMERQWQNIMDYGAKGDGTTDDRAAIQAALDAVGDSGGCVFVPHSDSGFLIDTTLIIKSYTTLLGVGRGSKIILDPSLDSPFTMITNTHWEGGSPADSGIVIDGIYWDMGRNYTIYDETSTWNQAGIIEIRYAHKCIVRNCFLTRSHKDGIAFRHTEDSKILNNVLWEMGEEALVVAKSVGKRNMVSANHCIMRDSSYTGQEGEWIAGALPAAMLIMGGNTTISGNIFRYGGGGIDMFQNVDTLLEIDTTSTIIISNNQFVDHHLNNCISPQRGYNLIISENVFRNCNAHGIYTTGPGEWEHGQPGPDSTPHDIIITGNQFLDHHKLGIWVEGGHGYTITNNVFSNLDTTAIICGGDRSVISGNRITQVASGYGIHVKGQRNSIVSNNQVSYVDKSGIYFNLFSTAHEYLSITGNSVRDCGDYGIDVLSLGFSTVSNNVCVGNALGGIHLSNSDYNVVSDNVCRKSPDSTQAYGILLESNSNKNIIHSNMLGGNVTAAISGGSDNAKYGNSVDTTDVAILTVDDSIKIGNYWQTGTIGTDGYVLTTDGAGWARWVAAPGAGSGDDIKIDTGDASVQVVDIVNPIFQEGSNIQFTIIGSDTVEIEGAAGGGTVDSFYVIFTDSASAANGNKHVSGYLTPNDTLYVDTTDDSDSYWAFRDSTTIVYVNDSTGDTILFIQDSTGFQGLRVSGVILDTLTVNNYMMVGLIYGDEVASYKIRIFDTVVFCSPQVRPSYSPNQTYYLDSNLITMEHIKKLISDSVAAGGTAIWVADNDTMLLIDADDDTLARYWDDDAGNVCWRSGADQTLKIVADTVVVGGDVIKDFTGTNLSVTGGVLNATGGGGVWVASNDTMFLVDADGDTLAAFWDDDAGNVRWQVGTEDQTLYFSIDTIGINLDEFGEPTEVIYSFTGTNLSITDGVLNAAGGGDGLDTTEVLDILRDSISGDATVGAGGALTIAANAVESTMIGPDQVNDLDINFGTGTDQVSSDDVTEGSSNKYDQALPDSSEWSEAYDSSQVGYLNPADANVDSAHWNAAWVWGDHSGQNYLDNDDGNVDTLGWGKGRDSGLVAWNWGDHSAAGYLSSLNELFAYFDRDYFDTLIDANGDSIICIYSDSTDLSIFDTDDLSEGASNKYNQTHTGDVTGSVALTIAANIIDTSDMAHAPLGKLIRDTITAEGYITGNESITLSGDVSGTGATAITTTIGASKVDSGMLNSTEVDPYVRELFGPFIDTTTLDTIQNAHHATYADTATVSISEYENLEVTGDFWVHGNFVHWNWASEVDIDKAWTIRPDTYITAPTYPGCEYAAKDYDDSCAICHIGDVYCPTGYSYNSTPYGWKRMRVGTPFAAGQSQFENICLYASNNGDHWLAYIEIDSITYPWPDSTFIGDDTILPSQYTWAYANPKYYDSTTLAVVWGDTVNNPIFTKDTFGANYLSDCDIDFADDGTVLIIFRESRPVDTHYIRIAWAQDPTNWSSDSCNVIMGEGDIVMGVSPSFRLDSNGTYEIWFAETQPATWTDTIISDSNYVLVKWESENYRDSSKWAPANTPWEAYYIDTGAVPDDTIRTISGVCLVQIPDSSKYQIWHPEVIALGVDDYLMPMVWAYMDAHDTSDIGLLQSNDGGITWRSADSILLRATMETPSLQGYRLYRGSGFALWDGDQWCIDWTFPAAQSGASAGDAIWHLFHTRIYFQGTDSLYVKCTTATVQGWKHFRDTIFIDTLHDSTQFPNDALSLDNINWTYEWIELAFISGHGRALGDSIYTYPAKFAITADSSVNYTVWSVAGNIDAGDRDTLLLGATVLYPCVIDSLEIEAYVSGDSGIVSGRFLGPDVSDALSLALDSTYWTSTTNVTGGSFWTPSTTGYSFTNNITSSAGSKYGIVLVQDFRADNDTTAFSARIRIKR